MCSQEKLGEKLKANLRRPAGAKRRLPRSVTRTVVPVLAYRKRDLGLAGASSRNCRARMSDEDPTTHLSSAVSMEMNIASILLLLGSMSTSSHGNGRKVLPRFIDTGYIKLRRRHIGWACNQARRKVGIIRALGHTLSQIFLMYRAHFHYSVRKGFALIFGLLLSGIFQAFDGEGGRIHAHQIFGGLLAAFSLYLHTTHPYKPA